MNIPRHVLIVEDEHAMGAGLCMAIRRSGFLPTLVSSASAAITACKKGDWSAVVLDIGLPDRSGLGVLAWIRERATQLPVLVITAHATLDHAIQAQKSGATMYMVKPLDLNQFESAIQSMIQSTAEPVGRTEPSGVPPAVTLLGSAPCMQPVFVGIARACASLAPTLIAGPSGSGKSLAATIIHAQGPRDGPMVSTSANEIHTPEDWERLLEKSSGATTLAIDGAEALPVFAQRWLAEQLTNISNRHATRWILMVRSLITPSNPHAGLQPELFFALNASTIQMPALRDRSADIPVLCDFFLAMQASHAVLTTPAIAALQCYAWPGNVRELRHVIDHALALCPDGRIFANHLPAHIADCHPTSASPVVTSELEVVLQRWLEPRGTDSYDDLLDAIESVMLRHLLECHDGKVTRLASEMGINRATLRQKLRRLGLHRETPGNDG